MRVQQARQLRKRSTEAEKRLWRHLRSRRLAAFKFRRQHPIGDRILYFFCAEAKLAIELDGSGHARHFGEVSDLETRTLREGDSRSSFLQPSGDVESRWCLERNNLRHRSRKIALASAASESPSTKQRALTSILPLRERRTRQRFVRVIDEPVSLACDAKPLVRMALRSAWRRWSKPV